QPERERPLADVRDDVVAAIRADRARRAALETVDAAVAEVAAGTPLPEVAEARGWLHMDMPGLRRGMPMPSMEANEAVFAAAEPAEGKVSAGRVVQDDGSILVFAVRKVTPGDGSEASEQERTMLR